MSYDIRGWLIGSAASYGNSSVFSETLSYMMPAKPGTTGKYDGSISEITVTKPSVTETYGYSYDIHKRLIGASHYIGANSTVESNTSTEKEMTYDRNGNMTGIKRYFTNGSHDELAFTHIGNRLMQWSNANNETGGYLYDDNGNRKNDGGNNLSISYNIANLPTRAIKTVMSQSDTVTYKYLADGTKVSALMNDGGGLKYRGSFVYEVTAEPVDWYDDLGNHITDPILWNALSSVAWDEGRIVVENMFVVDTVAVDEPLLRGHEPEVADSTEVGGYAGALFDEWHVRDHLGSTRAVVYLNLGLGGVQDVIERYDYHPYGKSIPTSMENSSTRHRFSGKEEQRFGFDIFNNEYKTDHGLLDFGARYYDPFSCRWTTPDPLAEKYPAISTYAYCANNPVNLVDPEGLSTHTDSLGVVIAVYNDGDNGIYRHLINSKDYDGSLLNIADGKYMGKTMYWDEFISPETGKVLENYTIAFGESFDSQITVSSAVADGLDLSFIALLSCPGGMFDIKSKEGRVGKKLHGFYVTSRSAGNYLAGFNAAQGTFLGDEIDFTTFQKLAGSLHVNGKNLLAAMRVLSKGKSYGKAPTYGELPYQYRMSKRGWDDGIVHKSFTATKK